MGRPLTGEEFARLLFGVRHTAYRLELQPVYLEPTEADSVAAFLAGRPGDPRDIEGAREWFDAVAAIVRGGGHVERVRVQEDPPTGYQRWERWLDLEWNKPAGEVIRYMTRRRALEVGLLPDAGETDWWLLDHTQLVVMHFDAHGSRVRTEAIHDIDRIEQAQRWWDLAVHNSAPLQRQTA